MLCAGCLHSFAVAPATRTSTGLQDPALLPNSHSPSAPINANATNLDALAIGLYAHHRVSRCALLPRKPCSGCTRTATMPTSMSSSMFSLMHRPACAAMPTPSFSLAVSAIAPSPWPDLVVPSLTSTLYTRPITSCVFCPRKTI
jgi:hypothetical protein